MLRKCAAPLAACGAPPAPALHGRAGRRRLTAICACQKFSPAAQQAQPAAAEALIPPALGAALAPFRLPTPEELDVQTAPRWTQTR